jgi:hypothetical protein
MLQLSDWVPPHYPYCYLKFQVGHNSILHPVVCFAGCIIYRQGVGAVLVGHRLNAIRNNTLMQGPLVISAFGAVISRL